MAKVIIEFDAKTGKILNATTKVKDELKKVGTSAKQTKPPQSFFKSLQNSWMGIAAVIAGVVIVMRQLIKFAKESITAFAREEKSIKTLNQALINSGKYTSETSKELRKFASELQNVTTFGNEAINEVMALIQPLAKLNTEGLKQVTQATLDLSVGMGIDLKAAASLMGKTLGSSTNALARYGIEVEGAVGSSDRLDGLLENINEKFGGFAQAQVQTYSGRVAQLKNLFGDLQEGVGGLIAGALTPFINAMINGLKATDNARESMLRLGKAIELAGENSLLSTVGMQGLNEETSKNQNVWDLITKAVIRYNVRVGKVMQLSSLRMQLFQTQMQKFSILTDKAADEALQKQIDNLKKLLEATKAIDIETEIERQFALLDARIKADEEAASASGTLTEETEDEKNGKLEESLAEQTRLKIEEKIREREIEIEALEQFGMDMDARDLMRQNERDNALLIKAEERDLLNGLNDAELQDFLIKEDEITDIMNKQFEARKKVAKEAVEIMIDGWTEEKTSAKEIFADLVKMATNEIAGILIMRAAAAFAGLNIPLGIAFTAGAASVKAFGGAYVSAISSAQGGALVTQPSVILAGEAGREMILPNNITETLMGIVEQNKAGGNISNSNTNNSNVNFSPVINYTGAETPEQLLDTLDKTSRVKFGKSIFRTA